MKKNKEILPLNKPQTQTSGIPKKYLSAGKLKRYQLRHRLGIYHV